MSKHIFEQTVANIKYEVQIGWDKPCHRYYFVISPYVNSGNVDELDDPVASNLYLPNPDSLTLEQIKAVCEDYGLLIPDHLLNNVKEDRHRDAVNKLERY